MASRTQRKSISAYFFLLVMVINLFTGTFGKIVPIQPIDQQNLQLVNINPFNRQRLIRQPVDPIGPIQIDDPEFPRFRPPIKVPPVLATLSPADFYKGNAQIKQSDGDIKNSQYFIAFSKYTNGCSYSACYYGWVANYTSVGGDAVQGYPLGTTSPKPIFKFEANSKTDYRISRHQDLSEDFLDIIEVGCELLEPTIGKVSRIVDSRARQNVRFLQSQAFEYAFIPQAQFERLQPVNTNDVQAYQFVNIEPASGREAPAFMSKMSIRPEAAYGQGLRVATLSKRLALDDIQINQNDLNERITVDGNYNVISRQRKVDLNIPSDSFGDEQKKIDFNSNIDVKLLKSGTEQTNNAPLIAYINTLSGKTVYTKADVDARRADINKIKVHDQAFNLIDTNTQAPTQKIAVDSTATIVLCDKIVALKAAANAQASSSSSPSTTTPSTPVRPIRPPRIIDLQFDEFPNPRYPYRRQIPRRLLLENTIFSYEKQLFQKTILGRKFKVSAKVEASIVDNKDIRFRGVILYEIFGQSKSIEAFSYKRNIAFNWSKNYPISGSWSFSIYIPLPPPVSFLGINFSFSVSFSLNVNLFVKGNPIAACVYRVQAGADVGTEVGVDASAAVRAVVIQGGVFIGGTLVRLSTDPKIGVEVNFENLAIKSDVTWYFHLKAFSFQWGFFWRYWRPFKWSSRKIIAKWPISNGITQDYLIYKS